MSPRRATRPLISGHNPVSLQVRVAEDARFELARALTGLRQVPDEREAISWALNLAPVPADRGGQPSTACKFVLVGLANRAGPDGGAAFPSVATLVR